MGVAALILGTFINALHAVSAATLVIMSVPETLSEFAVHGAQKVVVILKLEQLKYLLMAAPHHHPWKCGVSLAEWQSLSYCWVKVYLYLE